MISGSRFPNAVGRLTGLLILPWPVICGNSVAVSGHVVLVDSNSLAPVERAEVYIRRAGKNFLPPTKTDAKGMFAFANVEHAIYEPKNGGWKDGPWGKWL